MKRNESSISLIQTIIFVMINRNECIEGRKVELGTPGRIYTILCLVSRCKLLIYYLKIYPYTINM